MNSETEIPESVMLQQATVGCRQLRNNPHLRRNVMQSNNELSGTRSDASKSSRAIELGKVTRGAAATSERTPISRGRKALQTTMTAAAQVRAATLPDITPGTLRRGRKQISVEDDRCSTLRERRSNANECYEHGRKIGCERFEVAAAGPALQPKRERKHSAERPSREEGASERYR